MRWRSLLLDLALMAALWSCGANSRSTAIHDTYVATTIAATAFETYDREHELALVAAAKTKPEGQAALDAWGLERDKVNAVFTAVWRSIAAASEINDDPTYQGMLAAAMQLSAELKSLGVVP